MATGMLRGDLLSRLAEVELLYVKRLRALLAVYGNGVLTGPGLLSAAEAATIFRCAPRARAARSPTRRQPACPPSRPTSPTPF